MAVRPCGTRKHLAGFIVDSRAAPTLACRIMIHILRCHTKGFMPLDSIMPGEKVVSVNALLGPRFWGTDSR